MAFRAREKIAKPAKKKRAVAAAAEPADNGLADVNVQGPSRPRVKRTRAPVEIAEDPISVYASDEEEEQQNLWEERDAQFDSALTGADFGSEKPTDETGIMLSCKTALQNKVNEVCSCTQLMLYRH